MTGLEGFSNQEACRLLAAIYPTRTERALDRVVGIAYRHRAMYPIGDVADWARAFSQRRRADRACAAGRSLAPAKRGA